MRGLYTVYFTGIVVTAQQDFFEVTPADDRPIAIVGLFLSQESDVGDAAEEILRYSIVRGHTVGGSGGTTGLTPASLDPRDAAAGFSAEINNTTIASAGSPVILHADAFNIRSGLQMWFPPECYIDCDQGQTMIVVRLHTTPVDALTMNGVLYVKEL